MNNHTRHRVFGEIYDNLRMPVFICGTTPEHEVIFLNPAAKLAFAPMSARLPRAPGAPKEDTSLRHFLRFQSEKDFTLIDTMLKSVGAVNNFKTRVLSFLGDVMAVTIHANVITLHGESRVIFYVQGLSDNAWDAVGTENLLARLLETIYHSTNIDETIQSVLTIVGQQVNASRAYVFEDIDDETTRNTYEWCANGVSPAIQDLQNLKKADYDYQAIMHTSGMLITDDVAKLPDKDRRILESQGIKALAILPLFRLNQPLGYIGFDDCAGNRRWSLDEIRVLKSAAGIVSSLIVRRNAESYFRRGMEILQTVTDSIDDLIYISDPRTHNLVFVSKSLATTLGRSPEELLGRPCREMFANEPNRPCDMCDLLRHSDEDIDLEALKAKPRIWEFHRVSNGKYYMVKEAIIKWVDGTDAHLTTAVDISYRKQYEESLKRSATTDPMTAVFNRQWGVGKLKELLARPEEERRRTTLCFLDIDGLKSVNDRHGHAVGDEMIINTISIVHSCIRKNDFICRWGGDEFLLLLSCNLNDAINVVKKIDFAIEHFNNTQGKPYLLSVSAGLIDFAVPAESIDELVDLADRAMYRDKLRKKARRSTRWQTDGRGGGLGG